MKRIATLLLVFTMLLALVACGGGNAANNGVTTANNATNNANQTTSLQAETTTSRENTESGATSTEEATKSEESGKSEISFTEMVAVDNAECTIQITGIDADNMWGYTIEARLENKSADKTYMFTVETAAINGVQCDPLFASEVAAGKKANVNISFSDDTLKENGITEYTDIELTFRVHDSNDWIADAVAEETVHIYPYGEDKAVQFVRKAQASDNVIIDNDYVTVIVTGYEEDEIWGYSVNLFLLNKTDKNVMFSVDEVSVNGYMADPFYATSVSAGKCAFSSITWFDSTFEENDITEVKTIDFNFTAHDEDNWFSDYFVNETITLNP